MSFKRFIRSSDYPTQSLANILYTFQPFIKLKEDLEVAISGGKIVNSVPNISPGLGNNTFAYSHNAGITWFTVTLPAGAYQTQALNEVVGDALVANGHTITAINFIASVYLNRLQMDLDPNFRVDFTVSTLYTTLGFLSQIYNGGAGGALFTAPNIALFTDPTDNYFITTDIIDEGIFITNSFGGGVLKVVPGGVPGYPISLKESNGQYDYFPVNKRSIANLRIIIYDNFGRVADFRGEAYSIELHFRPIQN